MDNPGITVSPKRQLSDFSDRNFDFTPSTKRLSEDSAIERGAERGRRGRWKGEVGEMGEWEKGSIGEGDVVVAAVEPRDALCQTETGTDKIPFGRYICRSPSVLLSVCLCLLPLPLCFLLPLFS